MPYEAEIRTDRMQRRKPGDTPPTRLTRLGTTEIGSALRTGEKDGPYRIDIITTIKGWHITLKARVFGHDGTLPQQSVTLLDNVHLDRLFMDEKLVRRTAGGRVLPTLLPGEPDLTD